MSVLFFDESGEADGDGLAPRQGATSAKPRRSALTQVERTKPEADGELR
jgi:hypothetical protein